jgi:iron(III) transport system ATP-binding protein
MARVAMRSLNKKYDEVHAVIDVNLDIDDQEFVVLVGPSGCGKTTTLRLIAGLEIASAGRVLIGDADVTNLSAADRDVSMVFQSYALFPHMSVIENVAYGPSVQGAGKARARAMAMEKIELVGLKGLENRAPSELSGGQQQRVAVARALVLEPKVLLFDEPLSNLDAKLRRRVREEIRELQLSLRLTVAYVTHDQEEALAVSDRIIVMTNAKIAQIGTPRELYEAPADLFVADFIGDANILDGEVIGRTGAIARVRVGAMEIDATCRGPAVGTVKLVIRPDAITISAMRPNGPALQGRVVKAAYIGKHMEYSVEAGAARLFVIDGSTAAPIPLGTDVFLGVRPEKAIVISGVGDRGVAAPG